MITVPIVAITLVIACIISSFFIVLYNLSLKKNTDENLEGLKNTDIPIADGIEEIKIICK